MRERRWFKTCPACARTVEVLSNGQFKRHANGERMCVGSGHSAPLPLIPGGWKNA